MLRRASLAALMFAIAATISGAYQLQRRPTSVPAVSGCAGNKGPETTGTQTSAGAYTVYWQKWTADCTGTATQVRAYLCNASTTLGRNVRFAIYADSGASPSRPLGAPLGSSAANHLMGSTTSCPADADWEAGAISNVSITNGTVYWIAFMVWDNTTDIRYYPYTTATANNRCTMNSGAAQWPTNPAVCTLSAGEYPQQISGW